VGVDAGHGGINNHALYGTLLEKQANLLFAFELGKQLYAAGYDVQFTRTTDTAVTYGDIPTWHWLNDHWLYATDGIARYSDGVPRDDLQARSNVANDLCADVFISVHCNGSSSTAASGTENWASSHDVLGQQLGRYVQAAVLEQTRQRDRGAGITDFYVVRWANMPALLLETGFMSNPTEGRWIATPTWRQAYARGVVNGINRWWATNPTRAIHGRFAGATRSVSAVQASQAQWPSGAETLLLAATSDAPSALSAPVATAALDAPLLYVDLPGISGATRTEIARLSPSRIIASAARSPTPCSPWQLAPPASTPPPWRGSQAASRLRRPPFWQSSS
jgi:N-acetylmuramoyl-L-alanine amidase